MKTRPDKLNITVCGQDEFERTNGFEDKVREITSEVTKKYSQALLHEKCWMRRVIIKLRREIEIRNRIQQLSSAKNLYVLVQPSL